MIWSVFGCNFHFRYSAFFIFFQSRLKFQYIVTSLRTLVCVFNLVRGLSSYFIPRMFETSCCLQCVYNDLHIHMHGKPPTFSRSAYENAFFFCFVFFWRENVVSLGLEVGVGFEKVGVGHCKYFNVTFIRHSCQLIYLNDSSFFHSVVQLALDPFSGIVN